MGRDYLSGLVKLDNRLLILLDIDKIFGEEEMSAIKSAVEQQLVTQDNT